MIPSEVLEATAWVQTETPSLTVMWPWGLGGNSCCLSLSSSVSRDSHLCRVERIAHVRCWEQYLTYNKHHRNVRCLGRWWVWIWSLLLCITFYLLDTYKWGHNVMESIKQLYFLSSLSKYYIWSKFGLIYLLLKLWFKAYLEELDWNLMSVTWLV